MFRNDLTTVYNYMQNVETTVDVSTPSNGIGMSHKAHTGSARGNCPKDIYQACPPPNNAGHHRRSKVKSSRSRVILVSRTVWRWYGKVTLRQVWGVRA